jgi:hypothetical protein
LSESPKELRPGLASIGVPVYNGARYLREALDSLLAQDYTDFEVIISDNASDDATEAICREYAARDPRVRYHRSERNMGPAWNFLRVYELARGEYFMWAAHDDRRDPRCLGLCVAALERNPRALMCCMDARIIDEEGRDVSDAFPYRGYHPTGATPRERLRQMARSTAWLDIYSLFRTPVIAQTRLGANIWAGDIMLVSEVCLRGEVVATPEKLIDYRYFRAKTPEEMAESQSPPGDAAVPVSWSGLAAELIESVRLSPLGFAERLRLTCMLAVELCLRNPSVGWAIREEGFDGARHALARRDYRRALTLSSIGLLSLTTGLAGRVKNSAQYRGGKLKRTLLSRERASSGH